MKAEELKRKERDIEYIYKEIQLANERGEFKMVVMSYYYISPVTIATLLNDGFKCYQIKDSCGLTNWVIEW